MSKSAKPAVSKRIIKDVVFLGEKLSQKCFNVSQQMYNIELYKNASNYKDFYYLCAPTTKAAV